MNQRWGIYTTGGAAPLLQADSVGSVEYAQDYRISDYPQEKGAFESYNKVQVPFQAKVEFLLNVNREPFLQAIGAKLASLDLVQVVTPEISYPSANLTHYGYRRTARNGVTLIAVDVWVEEVRVTATTTLANTASPNGTDPVNDGPQQPTDTTTNQDPFDPNPTSPASATGIGEPASGGLSPGISPPPDPIDPNPTFSDSNTGAPLVPNDSSQMSSAQQRSVVGYSQAQGVPNAAAFPPDESGNVTTTYTDPPY
jgi:hypothetical protein